MRTLARVLWLLMLATAARAEPTVQDFLGNIEACERYDITACHRISHYAIGLPMAINAEAKASLERLKRFNAALERAQYFNKYLGECKEQWLSSCNKALAMPNLPPDKRADIQSLIAARPTSYPSPFWLVVLCLPFGYLAYAIFRKH